MQFVWDNVNILIVQTMKVTLKIIYMAIENHATASRTFILN